jgi:hypothetical protein
MNTIKKMGNWKFLLLIPAIALVAASCDGNNTPAEQTQVQSNQDKLVNAVPLPSLKNSLERANIKKRLELFDSPNKVSYIYLVSFGKVMAFYTIKGKVTSSTKRMTSNQKQLGDCGNYSGSNCTTIEAPSLDGTYGSSDAYIFFWTTDGVYVQWSGEYMEVDQPLKLSTQPELIQTIK